MKLIMETPILGTFIYNLYTSRKTIGKMFEEEYFFDNYNEIDNSNWRYPFKFSPDSSPYKRDITTLGVMRDFGQNNKKVVTMWGYVRSAGVSALPLLLWTLAVIAVVAIVIAIVLLCKHLKGRYVVLSK